MIQTKLITQRRQMIDRDINDYLISIGTVPQTKVQLVDIKMEYHEKDDTYDALVIYNQTKLMPSNPPVTNP